MTNQSCVFQLYYFAIVSTMAAPFPRSLLTSPSLGVQCLAPICLGLLHPRQGPRYDAPRVHRRGVGDPQALAMELLYVSF